MSRQAWYLYAIRIKNSDTNYNIWNTLCGAWNLPVIGEKMAQED
jgi:hypothetical protein